MALAKRGFKMIYSDISKRLIDFSSWRFSRRGLDIDVCDLGAVAGALPASDCVISFDVLEHLKNLPRTIKKICSSLSKNGSFIFSGAFSGGDLHLAENEVYDNYKNLNKLLESCGFKFSYKFSQHYFYKEAL